MLNTSFFVSYHVNGGGSLIVMVLAAVVVVVVVTASEVGVVFALGRGSKKRSLHSYSSAFLVCFSYSSFPRFSVFLVSQFLRFPVSSFLRFAFLSQR